MNKAKWKVVNINGKNTYICSNCGEEPLLIGEDFPIFCLSNYCPNCGYKMIKEDDLEEGR